MNGKADTIIFRQLFDSVSSTYTYLLADTATGEAVLIDPVREHVRPEALDALVVQESL
jgi:glyoxylase-like metal-dependent hydrolase (beta-lactamase superfamily II)